MSLLLLLNNSGGGAAPAPNLYETLFTDLSVTSGFVLHGTLSSFYEDSAGTTAASASGTSPVGQVSDISGLDNHAIQATSANKPVYYAAGGIKSFRSGTFAGGVDHFLRPTDTTGAAAAFTVVLVADIDTQSEPVANWGIALTNYDAGWGTGVYVRHGFKPSGTGYALCSSGVSELNTGAAMGDGAPKIMVIRRSGTGSNQTRINAYGIDGTSLGTVQGTQDAVETAGLIIGGYNGVGADGMRFAFLMYANGVDIGDVNEATVVSDLVATFGAWGGA